MNSLTAATKSSGVLHRPTRKRVNAPVGVSRWLTRTACAAHLYPCGFGFAILTVRASHSWQATGSPLRRFATRTYASSGLLARISHTQSTAAADLAASTALRDPQAVAPGLLNVPYSTFAGASVARLVSTAISTPSLRSGVRIAGLGLCHRKEHFEEYKNNSCLTAALWRDCKS